MKYTACFVILLSLLLFSNACEDSYGVDENVRVDDKDAEYSKYLPVEVGNYSLANVYEIDKNGDRTGNIIYRNAKLVFEDTLMFMGNKCYTYTLYDEDSNKVWSFPLYSDGPQLWIYSYEYNDILRFYKEEYNLDIPWPGGEKMWLAVDLSRDMWHGFDEVDIRGHEMADTARLDATVRYTGEKVGTYKKNIGGKSYNVIKTKAIFSFDLTATMNGKEIYRIWSVYDESHFAKDLGLIRIINPVTYVDFGNGRHKRCGYDIEVIKAYLQEK